jgi:peptidoglycan/xylan/chitin deacetylase (PgdA/CDA1 family)
LSVLATLAVIVGIAVVGGGHATRSAAAPAPGFFTRLQTLAGTGPGSFNAAERSAENGAIDRTLAITPYVRVAGAQHREVALTFDDGPGPYTPQVLAILKRMNVPATFFEVGVAEQYFHASTSQIVAAGYPIGDHTQTHAPMGRISPAEQESQLLQQTTSISAYGAPFPRLFRPPYGLWDADTLALLRKYRMLMVLWTVDTNDYRQPGVATIVHSVLSGVKPGAIVLMHDAGGIRTETVEALPTIIRKLRARKYRFVTVPRLLLDNPPTAAAQAGVVPGGGG